MNTVEFSIDVHGRGVVKIDGVAVSARRISVQSEVGKPSVVSLEILAKVDGRVEVDRLITETPKGSHEIQPGEQVAD